MYKQLPNALLKTPLKNQNFDLKVGFFDASNIQRSSMLNFTLAIYHMNGTFAGY